MSRSLAYRMRQELSIFPKDPPETNLLSPCEKWKDEYESQLIGIFHYIIVSISCGRGWVYKERSYNGFGNRVACSPRLEQTDLMVSCMKTRVSAASSGASGSPVISKNPRAPSPWN